MGLIRHIARQTARQFIRTIRDRIISQDDLEHDCIVEVLRDHRCLSETFIRRKCWWTMLMAYRRHKRSRLLMAKLVVHNAKADFDAETAIAVCRDNPFELLCRAEEADRVRRILRKMGKRADPLRTYYLDGRYWGCAHGRLNRSLALARAIAAEEKIA